MKPLALMYYCEDCGHGYYIPKSDPDKHLLGLSMACPNTNCSGEVEYGTPADVVCSATLTARVLYEACMGMGFPHERICHPEHLKRIFDGAVVLAVELEATGKNRSLISSMLVETAEKKKKTIYFAMSTKGATIYRVEEHPDVQ